MKLSNENEDDAYAFKEEDDFQPLPAETFRSLKQQRNQRSNGAISSPKKGVASNLKEKQGVTSSRRSNNNTQDISQTEYSKGGMLVLFIFLNIKCTILKARSYTV